MTARYAIYFAPADDTELDLFGATVLCRRATDATHWQHPELPVPFPAMSCWAERIQRPAHYGFHATIKAPFELAAGQSIDELETELDEFCSQQNCIDLSGMCPARTTRYDALAFDQQPAALWQLAADCVTKFEKYRAPLAQSDITRRNPSSLSVRQNEYLQKYGYPHILDDFNFHMTLSGTNDHSDTDYLNWLNELYRSMISESPVFDRLCIFFQPDRETPFVRKSEFVFPSR